MSFRKRGSGGKRDAAEGPIVEALRGLGCTICFLSGQGNPDLLVRSPAGRWVPIEVKSGKSGFTPNQDPTAYPVARTPQEAVDAVFG